MSECENGFSREKAVRISAELLRNAGIAFFPVDIRRMLDQSFSKQIILIPYGSAEKIAEENPARTVPDPRLLSKDGFCVRIRDALVDFEIESMIGNIWNIYYNESSLHERIRFTLMHELGHVLLGHHQLLEIDSTAEIEEMPEYRIADAQADRFSINTLAPAPAVARLLRKHGFQYSRRNREWHIKNRNAPFLRNLGQDPDPAELLKTAFGISRTAADRRLVELVDELEIWESLDPALYKHIEQIGHRSGWYCWVCHTRRRTSSAYCPGCGKGWSYEYVDYGKPSRPVIALKSNGQFIFCSVCGNTEYPEDAEYCPVCGNPVVNECQNAMYTDGDFVRSGMQVIRGTHRCKPTDIYCGTCGSTRSMRDGRYCADCMQPLENACTGTSEVKGSTHSCGANDCYCTVCGQPTMFYQAGFLKDYLMSETYAALLKDESQISRAKAPTIVIEPYGAMRFLCQEDRPCQPSVS